MAETTKYCLKIAYVGTDYQGWQRQAKTGANDKPSIQILIESACEQVLGEKVSLTASGRTDSGVHARRQVAHFKAATKLGPEILLKAINANLPNDIRVLSLEIVDMDFHAQKSARAKIYRYFLLINTNAETRNFQHINWPFLKNYTWFVAPKIDLGRMRECLKLLEGEHDFKSFQNRGTPVKSTVRKIISAELIEHASPSAQNFPWEPPPELGVRLVEIRLHGTGFLKQMVRNIVGNLVAAGTQKISLADFAAILAARDRREGGVTAPARGLFLDEVFYQSESR